VKNILARGGIEFLAVLLGITLSLWVDENSKNKDIHLSFDFETLPKYPFELLQGYVLNAKMSLHTVGHWSR